MRNSTICSISPAFLGAGEGTVQKWEKGALLYPKNAKGVRSEFHQDLLPDSALAARLITYKSSAAGTQENIPISENPSLPTHKSCTNSPALPQHATT